MRLTKGADYGARGVVHLAKLPPNAVALVSHIAKAEGVPESYLAKIFQGLAKEGIVRSHRGAKGGFSLARPAKEISFRQVIEAVDGPVALCQCLNPDKGCDRVAGCSLYPILAQAQARLLSVLDNTTLLDLARSGDAPWIGGDRTALVE